MNPRSALLFCCFTATIFLANSNIIKETFETCISSCHRNCKECFFKLEKTYCDEDNKKCEAECFKKHEPCKTCGANSDCKVDGSKVTCFCKPGYSGAPPNCKKPECSSNNDCLQDKQCKDWRCVNPCDAVKCSNNAECVVENREGKCKCKKGFTGHPPNCERQGCSSDKECPKGKVCNNKKCENPCETVKCGNNAECVIENREGKCKCIKGFTGHPPNCERQGCSADKECPKGKLCNNKKCENPCETVKCGNNAECVIENREVKCKCIKGYIGHPPNCEKPGCNSDQECPNDKACKDKKCINPCEDYKKCNKNEICVVDQHKCQCTISGPKSTN